MKVASLWAYLRNSTDDDREQLIYTAGTLHLFGHRTKSPDGTFEATLYGEGEEFAESFINNSLSVLFKISNSRITAILLHEDGIVEIRSIEKGQLQPPTKYPATQRIASMIEILGQLTKASPEDLPQLQTKASEVLSQAAIEMALEPVQ